MKESEKRNLIDRILKAAEDPKGARVSASVFINNATREDAMFFLDYLGGTDAGQKKMARFIVGQFGLAEAIAPLLQELHQAIGSFTFLPDAEYKESIFYPNLIEIFETLFTIIRRENLKNDDLLTLSEDVFRKTTNEDLRFTLIKLIAYLGDRFDFLMTLYPKMGEKERRAMYHIYAVVEAPERLKLFRAGLVDERNFEFVVSNLLKFNAGKELLRRELPGLSGMNRQAVLKKLQDEYIPELEESLLFILENDDNKYTIELAAEILKNSTNPHFPLDTIRNLAATSFSPDIVKSTLEIIEHFEGKEAAKTLIGAFSSQTVQKNRILILDHLQKQVKGDQGLSEENSRLLEPLLLPIFDTLSQEKEELYIAVMRILPQLFFPHSGAVKAVRRRVVDFLKNAEDIISTTLKNNLGETIGRLNHIIQRLEEAEAKVKKIFMLFEVEPERIEAERLTKLREQLRELEQIDADSLQKLREMLIQIHEKSGDDWKKRSITVELLGEYGREEDLPRLQQILVSESSLGVRVTVQNAVKRLRERFDLGEDLAVVIDPLFYICKVIGDTLKEKHYQVICLKAPREFDVVTDQRFKYIFFSDSFLAELPRMFNYLSSHRTCTLVLVSAAPENHTALVQQHPGVKILKKPFNNDTLNALLQ